MDWLSALWLSMVCGATVYLGLGVMWVHHYFTDADYLAGVNAESLQGLGLALFTFIIIPAIMLVMHITGVITMWGVEDVFTHIRLHG